VTTLQDYLSKIDLATLAIPSNIAYGTAIHARGAIEAIHRATETFEAWAGGLDGTVKEGAGSRRRVKLWLDNGELRWHCSGNPKDHDIFCKHCVAAALYVKHD